MTSNPGASEAKALKPAVPAESVPEPAAPWSEKAFWPILALIMLAGLVCRGVLLADYLHSPLAAVPLNDAETYWNWAGRIAGGWIIDKVPFFSAPLYPYLLALVRAESGGLPAVYLLQMLADIAPAGLLAYMGRARFGAGTGLAAAALFLALQEPASFELRVLATCLHLFLVTVTWAVLVRVQSKQSFGRLLATGVALGLLSLANAPAILLVPLVAGWLFWQSGRRRGAAGRAVLVAVVAAVVMAPATLHNWWVSGDVFLIQAVGGITLRFGNHPGANGTLTPLPGMSARREDMHADAARVYRDATGKEPTWKAVDRYFRDQVFQYWRSEPGRAVELAGRKLYLLLTSRNYGDIYQPNAELACGQNRWLRLAPLPTPWLLGPALVGLVLLMRRPVHYGAEWMLFVVPPVIVTALFFYSPRYRAPLLPLATITAAWAITRAVQWRQHKVAAGAVVAALAASIALGAVNQATGRDPVDISTAHFNLASALDRQGNMDAAVKTWRDGLRLAPDNVAARITLADMLNSRGRAEEALLEYRSAEALAPEDGRLRLACGYLLLRLQRLSEARDEFAVAAHVMADPFDAWLQVGRIDAQLRDFPSARSAFERALMLRPQSVETLHDLGVLSATEGRLSEALDFLRRALAIDPTDAKCRAAVQQIERAQTRQSGGGGP